MTDLKIALRFVYAGWFFAGAATAFMIAALGEAAAGCACLSIASGIYAYALIVRSEGR